MKKICALVVCIVMLFSVFPEIITPEAYADDATLRIKLAEQIKNNKNIELQKGNHATLYAWDEYELDEDGGYVKNPNNPKKRIERKVIKSHGTGEMDYAGAYYNIKDTAEGKMAKNSSYADTKEGLNSKAPGKKVNLSVAMLRAILDLEKAYGHMYITAISGGCHSKDSKHYKGKAFDANNIGGKVSKEKGIQIYEYLTKKGYDVYGFNVKVDGVNKKTVKEGGHYHIYIKGWKGVEDVNSESSTKYLTYNSHIYERYDYHLTWEEAEKFCENLGGHLVTITSAEEQAKVVELLSGCPHGFYHIGLKKKNGNWNWVSQESSAYRNWDSAEGDTEGEDYAAVIGIDYGNNKTVGEWIDEPNNGSKSGFYAIKNGGFICEYDNKKSYTPVPGKMGVYENRIYQRFDYHMTWEEAAAYCKNLGGHLVSITSQAEQDFIVKNILSDCMNNFYHIGLDKKDGSWSWATWEDFSYNNWDSVEGTTAGQDYAAIIGKYDGANKTVGEWIDEPNDGGNSGFYAIYNSGFIFESDSSTDALEAYLEECDWLLSYADLSIVNTTELKSLPCSKKTNAASEDLGTLKSGDTLVATKLWWNGYNYWYEVEYEVESNSNYWNSNKMNQKGYVFAGDVTATARFDCGDVTENPSMPTGQLKKTDLLNKDFDLTGIIDAGYLELAKVGAFVIDVKDAGPYWIMYPLTGITNQPVSGSSWPINKTWLDNESKSVSLKSLCDFKSLPEGNYLYIISAYLKNNITTGAKTMKAVTGLVSLKNSAFSVVDDITYELTYDANGGSNPPDIETVKANTERKLKASGIMSRDGYTFVGWDLDPSSTTANYHPEDLYLMENDTTFYAIWRGNNMTIQYDANGGSGTMEPVNVTFGDTFTVPDCSFTKEGCTFLGYRAYCPKNGTWYVEGEGWLSLNKISANGYGRRVYNKGSEIDLDSDWVKGSPEATTFILVAQWTDDGQSGSTEEDEYILITPTYTFHQLNRELIVQGDGYMRDFSSFSNAPWRAYCNQVDRIQIRQLTGIGRNAFSRSSVRVIELNSRLKSIGKNAFSMAQLTTITIPESVKYIGEDAFSYNSQLQVLNIVSESKALAESDLASAFRECGQLNTITVADDNPAFRVENNTLLSADGKRLIMAIPSGEEYTVPDGVEVIAKNAFLRGEFKTLYLPESLRIIEDGAFYRCSSITAIYHGDSVGFPDSVQTIGKNAFRHASLNSIVFGMDSNLESIGANAFRGYYTTSVTIPPRVQSIGYNAFDLLGTQIDSSVSQVMIEFLGDAPVFDQNAFSGVKHMDGTPILAYYPGNLPSWTPDKLQDYGGNITWMRSDWNTYTFRFDANGGFGGPENIVANSTFVIPAAVPERLGYVFLGWAHEPDAIEEAYRPGEQYTPDNLEETDVISFYAVWQKNQNETEEYVIDLYDSLIGNAAVTQIVGSTQELNNGKTAIQLAYEMFFSEEFLVKNYCSYHFVTALYNGLLSRNPEPDELEELTEKIDYEEMCWEEAFNEIITSAEYIAKCQSAGMTVGTPIDVPEYGTYPSGFCIVEGHEESEAHVCDLFYEEGCDATCGMPGMMAHYKCDECGALYADGGGEIRISEKSLISGQPLGHNFSEGFCVRCGEKDPSVNLHVVIYFANGGENEPATQIKWENVPLTLSDASPELADCAFLGWAVTSDGPIPVYQGGESYETDENLFLYAVWRSTVSPDTILPSALHIIEAEAFEGSAFFYVRLSEDVTGIGSRAFADCEYLKHIYIPEATTQIDEHAFDGVVDLTIHGVAGSFAETFATANGYAFTAAE